MVRTRPVYEALRSPRKRKQVRIVPSQQDDRKDARKFETEYGKEFHPALVPKVTTDKKQSHLRVPAGVYTNKSARVTQPIYNQTVSNVDDVPVAKATSPKKSDITAVTSQYRYAWVDELAKQYATKHSNNGATQTQ